jgi:hypothetical protein
MCYVSPKWFSDQDLRYRAQAPVYAHARARARVREEKSLHAKRTLVIWPVKLLHLPLPEPGKNA